MGTENEQTTSFPDFFNTVRNEIIKERMVLNPPKTQPNIMDVKFEVSDESGEHILYARIASTDDQNVVIPYVCEKLERHSALNQNFNLKKPTSVEKVDFYYLVQFSRTK